MLFQVVNEKRQTAIPVGKRNGQPRDAGIITEGEPSPLNISKKYALLQFVIKKKKSMQFALGFTYFQELQFSYLKGVSNDSLLEVLYDLPFLLVLMS